MSQIAEPGTVITLKVDEEWKCHCQASGSPLTELINRSHWSERLTHRCTSCGTERTLVRGQLTTPKARKEPAR